MMKKKITLFCVLAVTHLALWAGEVVSADTITVEVYYRQGSSRLDPAYRDNGSRLDILVEALRKLSSDSTLCLDRFDIISGASPEGSALLNRRLSESRTRNIRAYLDGRVVPTLASLITESHVGVDWENLRIRVEGSDMPYKEDVLDILTSTPEQVVRNGLVVDSRKRQLMNLHGGECWHYMEIYFFPGMRRSYVKLEYSSIPEPSASEKAMETGSVEMTDTLIFIRQDEICPEDSVIILKVESVPSFPFRMAVRTNLLYDALLVPNIGAEFYLGKGFSIGGNWMYAWWRNNSRHRYWRIYGGELAMRKYFSRPGGGSPLSGHHLGVYGQVFTYDFETGRKGYMGGRPGGTLWEKMNYGAGVEYGYSLPIARKLNLDFVIGLGYWGGTYYEYEPMNNHYVWRQTRQRHRFGPTKAEVSLVWLLGRENCNEKKGGRQ